MKLITGGLRAERLKIIHRILHLEGERLSAILVLSRNELSMNYVNNFYNNVLIFTRNNVLIDSRNKFINRCKGICIDRCQE